jgi:hypothetical protein
MVHQKAGLWAGRREKTCLGAWSIAPSVEEGQQSEVFEEIASLLSV